MPIYEYRCLSCGKVFSHLHGVTQDHSDPVCPRCGGTNLKRLMSRFARIRSEEEMLENLTAVVERIGDPEDPKTLLKATKLMSKHFGDEFGEEVFEEIEHEVERELSRSREEREEAESGEEESSSSESEETSDLS